MAANQMLGTTPKGFYASCEVLNELPSPVLRELSQAVAISGNANSSQAIIARYLTAQKERDATMAKQAVFTLAQMGGAVNALVFIYKQCKSLVTTAGQSASSLKDAFSQGLAPALVDEARHVVIDAYIASTSTSTSTSESSTVSDMASSLSLGSVVGLDWKIGMGIMSDSCNNLKAPFVSVVWKIAEPSGVRHVPMEMTIPQFQQLHSSFESLAASLESI